MRQNNRINSESRQAIRDAADRSFDSRYLAAKKTIDDQSLNHHVWKTLHSSLQQTPRSKPLNILEIGAGIGTMFERMVDRGLLTGPATYVATDSDPGQLAAARQYLSQWAKRRGHALLWSGEYGGDLHTSRADISLSLALASAEELADRADALTPFHLVIAHAVLDLVDFPVVLHRLLSRLAANGMAYFTCNFDGETLFLPENEDDQEIIGLYHASMETRLRGASHTGRRLLGFLQGPPLDLLAAGSSDWIVHPRDRRYSKDEVFFLHAIIDTVEKELAKKPSPPSSLAAWASVRRRQVEAGELSLLARHLDILARRLPAPP
ncbi:class I SAM-dependent methyltransferase [Desulfopila sp. IMCC35006]|uniref:class I SAM-dependent methyltransferase n=1 Tax=Desulfopila sp. IMCC35006 TaxID=2569542 RepID=UPI0010AC615C|nr:class I SAM-dependent methyltransferase [Desulfopila sp. IMCC35006]TKB27658.1 class I SAM-dependent methyltransferase [Desulfopila sp. IMCC35006]